MNEEALKAKLEKTLSDTSTIIGTQFDREVVNSPNVVIMNDPRYKNAFLINDSLYLSFEPVQIDLKNSKRKTSKDYTYSISLDTSHIKMVFNRHNKPYSGQNRLIT